MLRCFPWARHRPRAVLLETNQMGDLRDVDRYFHRKGYVNRETFVDLRTVASARARTVQRRARPESDSESCSYAMNPAAFLTRQSARASAEPRPGNASWRPMWVDNLYVPASGPPTVYPPTQANALSCNLLDEKRFRREWCQPWIDWQPSSNAGLRECDDDI